MLWPGGSPCQRTHILTINPPRLDRRHVIHGWHGAFSCLGPQLIVSYSIMEIIFNSVDGTGPRRRFRHGLVR